MSIAVQSPGLYDNNRKLMSAIEAETGNFKGVTGIEEEEKEKDIII